MRSVTKRLCAQTSPWKRNPDASKTGVWTSSSMRRLDTAHNQFFLCCELVNRLSRRRLLSSRRFPASLAGNHWKGTNLASAEFVLFPVGSVGNEQRSVRPQEPSQKKTSADAIFFLALGFWSAAQIMLRRTRRWVGVGHLFPMFLSADCQTGPKRLPRHLSTNYSLRWRGCLLGTSLFLFFRRVTRREENKRPARQNSSGRPSDAEFFVGWVWRCDARRQAGYSYQISKHFSIFCGFEIFGKNSACRRRVLLSTE